MKIAIATDDWRTISPQFISAKGFAILGFEGTILKSIGYRTVIITAYESCINGALQRFKRYSVIHNLLKDCDVVIAYVLEEQIIIDLKRIDINVYQTEETNVKKALALFLSNNLACVSDQLN